MKKHILTSIWSAQHPNIGQNLQHLCVQVNLAGENFIMRGAPTLGKKGSK